MICLPSASANVFRFPVMASVEIPITSAAARIRAGALSINMILRPSVNVLGDMLRFGGRK
jgi:hypothetical protein